MESAYRTQQDLMARKARENGIPTSEITKQFQATLSQIYQQNPQCTEAWALGKAEYHVVCKFPAISFVFHEFFASTLKY